MKRSKINQCIKEMEKLAKEHCLRFVTGHRKTGKTNPKNMMKSETICSDGILLIMGLEILIK